MARSLDPKSAAEEIRPNVHMGRLTPEEQHMHVFTVSVCEYLGIAPDPINFMAVVKALHDADIQPYLIQEYPKMLVVDGKPIRAGVEQDGPDEEGPIIVFENEDEEKEYNADGPAPEKAETIEEIEANKKSKPKGNKPAVGADGDKPAVGADGEKAADPT